MVLYVLVAKMVKFGTVKLIVVSVLMEWIGMWIKIAVSLVLAIKSGITKIIDVNAVKIVIGIQDNKNVFNVTII